MGKKRRSREFKKNTDIIDIEEARKKRQEKRDKLAEEIRAREEERSAGKVSARKKSKRNRLRLIYTVIIVIVIAAVGVSVYNIISLKAEERAIIKEQKELKDKKEKLSKELDNLNDPEYIEQQAREQLRLIMPGEKIYVFPETKKESKPSE